MTKDELINLISTAFVGFEFPGNENLIDSSYGDEPALVRDHFAGQSDWQILKRESIDLDGALSFFSNKAFIFYLPAFLIADINEPLDFNDPSIRLCWPLTPQSENVKIAKTFGNGTIGDRAKKCFDSLTKEQTHAIVSYLQWRLSQDENNYTIKQALHNYWLPRII
ncbi:MAG: DUF6714 family protein [Sphingobacteriaceae bacterium]|jgi:hypothetical protein